MTKIFNYLVDLFSYLMYYYNKVGYIMAMKNTKNNSGIRFDLRSNLKQYFLQSYSSAITACIFLVLIFTICTESFMSQYNLFNLSRTASIYAFIAAAQLMVVVIGGMNVSVGSVGALASVVLGEAMQNFSLSIPTSIVLTLLVGLLCGLINGVLITKLKLSSFVITLAMSFVYNGIAMGISHGYSYTIADSFSKLGRGKFLFTPSLFVLMLIFVVILAVFFRRARFGRDILATGGNPTAASLSGIKVDKVVVICNVLSCLLASVSALLWASRTGSAAPTTGADWMLYSVAVCAIGGIQLAGGNFTAIGFFCGAWILTMIRNGLTMMNVDIYFEQTFLGLIILIAVSVESIRSRVANRIHLM